MIYLTNGNMPLNAAYADEIVQEENSTYQLSFRFPTSDPLWEKLKEETFLTADDLHGEQDFVIFEVEKKHGYIQVYANQVFTLLNNYVVNPISLDRQTGSTALSRFAGSITRDNPFSFFSDIEDRHTFNIVSKNAMEAFAKDKHSIICQWGGDLVRQGYQVRLLKNGGSENESLFMYKKNLSSYQHKTSTKSLKTRITFIATVKGEGEKAPDRTFTVTIDSPLINKYSQIYEDVIEVNDQDVKDEVSLRKYGEQYYRTSLCDMMEDSLEIEVVGQSDVPVQMFDVVSIFHERYNLDVRKKITKYTYSPMAKKLKSIGFGQFQSGLANAIGNAVSDAVKGEAQQLQGNFERQLARELKNANLAFDRRKEELVSQFTDDVNAIKAKAEEVKRELSDNIDQRFSSFNNGPLQEVKRRAEEALRNAGASSVLAQEAKRIGLDSIAKLEEFKSQATSAQMTLSSDLDALANEVLSKQEQIKDEVDEQVKALIQTKNELAGVKSAQSTYEETTTRRLAELTNLANGKASKSELTQTAEELASKLASVQASGRNLFLNSLFKQDISKTGIWTTSTYEATIDSTDKYLGYNALKIVGQNPSGRDSGNPKITYPAFGQFGKNVPGSMTNQDVTISFYAKASKNGIMLRSRLGNIGYKSGNVILSTEIKRYVIHIPKGWTNESKFTTNEWLFNFNQEGTVWIWMPKFEISDVDTSYSEAPEDIEGQISTVESNFRQRADALDAGVRSLTEGLRTKADISSLNVTAENIRQSVKSLETSTQNKLDQKLSMTEFEVRAGSIRQEILNATNDKADKTLVMAEAGKLREEFSNLRVGGRNLLRGSKGPFMPDKKPSTFDNNVLYADQTSIYMEQGQEYIISAKTDGVFSSIHYNAESDNVVLWIVEKNYRSYRVVSDANTGTSGTKFVWDKPTGIYHLRVNTYHKEATKSVWDVKIEKGNVATDWSPAPEDTDGLITEVKATFERTAQSLRTDLSAIQEYVNKDGQRQDSLQRYTREESARQASAVRELVARDYVGKSTYQEDVRGLERRFEAITNPQNGSIATQIANYKNSVDGRFVDITSLIAGKANQTDFQRVKETSQLYERILGSTDNGIANNIARMAMTNQLFQVEVSKNEGLKTVQRQLAGSWGVHNKNSVNEIIAGFNLAGRNAGIKAETIRLEGKTLLDELTAIQGYFKRLFVGEGTFATLNTDILRANSITADKLVFNEALANRLVSNEIITSKLVASRAFVNALNAVTIDASQIVTGTLKGDRIYGGTIRGANIYGGTLTGHTKIQLGSYGSFDTVNGGLQINVPRDYNAKDGLGVQFIGSYGRGENVPYGLFIYKDSDFTVGGTVETSNEFLLTVEGYINANGIGWMKTGKGSVNGQTTATIGLWNSENVSLDFGGSGNDIYYSYNGTAYSLWSVVKQHFSDRRLKENIVDCNHKALDYIQHFQFKEYDWKKQEDRPQQAHTKIGLIAQDVQEIDPTLVYENGDTLNLDNLRLTTIALKAIQELSQRIEALERKLA
ncbi:phage tail spike protein [uncultured Streptococcus sp.]|uniref:phage tail spike protein n=1 Tax=uncultured Streptococcus sp. TaxID=83427 RepID=UPI00288C596A|nr:phage tail spike protein [uncultured Streptococcus sp.]